MGACQALSCIVLLSLFVSSSASILNDVCKSLGASNDDIGYDYCIRFFRAFTVPAPPPTSAASSSSPRRSSEQRPPTPATASTLSRPWRRTGRSPGASPTATRCTRAHCTCSTRRRRPSSRAICRTRRRTSTPLENPDVCEEGFRELGVRSPVADEDYEFTKGCSIALSIASTL
ncbi:unnamed protein product [Triticum turgidum subsp. durum]|uniref:Pectinesterase inhibitor domain-containing protein n=1 Tax=Triticum turgidum subsp. durum TaxID=4567 RepID=A0A9R1PY23_TRITD|nr:unnamed protein product [Triticum turgidum subsp. durum]